MATFTQAIRSGDLEWARFHLNNGVDPNYYDDSDGSTPLLRAISGCDIDMIKLLLEYGADINLVEPTYYDTPFNWAIQMYFINPTEKEKCSQIACLLIDKMPDINIKNHYGRTPLHMAVATNDIFLIRKMLDKGADINAVNNEGLTPINIARHPEVISLLADYHRSQIIDLATAAKTT